MKSPGAATGGRRRWIAPQVSGRLVLGALIMIAQGLWVGVRVAQSVAQDVDPGAWALVHPRAPVAADGYR
ncbi:hypothetical protein [uncultured Cellulomonas sp.]|uniref:hypothetical protein n=1 Tax=uncultured Cellulomonas sp. TaxID=189682 RepID=UPI0026055CD1|nr:hypothetical protein [uncultured Cellulomonas sp.]